MPTGVAIGSVRCPIEPIAAQPRLHLTVLIGLLGERRERCPVVMAVVLGMWLALMGVGLLWSSIESVRRRWPRSPER